MTHSVPSPARAAVIGAWPGRPLAPAAASQVAEDGGLLLVRTSALAFGAALGFNMAAWTLAAQWMGVAAAARPNRSPDAPDTGAAAAAPEPPRTRRRITLDGSPERSLEAEAPPRAAPMRRPPEPPAVHAAGF